MFHSINKNILIILYPREFTIFDLNINKKISHFKLEKSYNSFIQVTLLVL